MHGNVQVAPNSVIPAKAGIQKFLILHGFKDTGFPIKDFGNDVLSFCGKLFYSKWFHLNMTGPWAVPLAPNTRY